MSLIEQYKMERERQRKVSIEIKGMILRWYCCFILIKIFKFAVGSCSWQKRKRYADWERNSFQKHSPCPISTGHSFPEGKGYLVYLFARVCLVSHFISICVPVAMVGLFTVAKLNLSFEGGKAKVQGTMVFVQMCFDVSLCLEWKFTSVLLVVNMHKQEGMVVTLYFVVLRYTR
jgi:hypothetical protein